MQHFSVEVNCKTRLLVSVPPPKKKVFTGYQQEIARRLDSFPEGGMQLETMFVAKSVWPVT